MRLIIVKYVERFMKQYYSESDRTRAQVAKIASITSIEHNSSETPNQYANKLGNRDLNKAFYSTIVTNS
jgi:hypothetical protein